METNLSIENLCGGAVKERINRALRKVSDNVLDPNTEAKKKREITLKLTFIPDEDDREAVSVEANVSTKLAPEEGCSTQFYINRDIDNDTVTITEFVKGQLRGQMSLDDFGLSITDSDSQEEEHENPTIMDFRKSAYAQEG